MSDKGLSIEYAPLTPHYRCVVCGRPRPYGCAHHPDEYEPGAVDAWVWDPDDDSTYREVTA